MILTFFKGLLRELWLLVKDPRGIFMFLVAPLLMNIVVCGAFQNGIVNHIPLAAVEMSSSAKTRELIRAFDESDRFDVTLVLQDLDEAKQKMEEGEVQGIIVIPADYTRSLQLGQQAEVLVGINSANNLVGNSAVVSVMQVVKTVSSQIAVKSYVASGSSVAEGTAKVMPISTVLRPWFNPQFSYLMYLGLGLTGLVYHQLFLSAVAGSFADEKKEGILSGKFRKRDAILYYFDKMLFYGIAGFFNLLLNYAVIMKIYSFPMRGAQADFLLFSACFVFCLLGFGALLGLLCKNSLHAMQWLMALTYPFFVLAGFSWPHTEMPDFLVRIANYLPVTHYLGPVRSIILMGIGFERISLQHNRAMLLTLGVGAFVLSFVVFAWQLCRAEKKQKTAEKNTQTEGVQA